MSGIPVTVIDYGIGNLHNVVRALEYCGASVTVTERAEPGHVPERLVLPGVGAFADGMAEMRARGFDDWVRRYADNGRPLLGICVGAQMLFDASEEFGEHAGLGLIAGRVKPVPPHRADGGVHCIPHIGWSGLEKLNPQTDWRGTLLQGIPVSSPAYFVHSFAPVPAYEENRLADTWYDGVRICAAVIADHIYGCQFHPELSAAIGLQILRNFLTDSLGETVRFA